MANFTLSTNVYNAIYVDLTASITGDGSSPATPLNYMPTLTLGVPSGTAYIFRRTTTPVVLPYTTTQTISANNIALIGCPINGDATYSVVPSANYWSSDPGAYCTIAISGSISSDNFKFTGTLPYIERLSIIRPYNTISQGGNNGVINIFTNTQSTINNCNISTSGANYSAVPGSYFASNGIVLNGGNFISIVNTTMDIPGICLYNSGNSLNNLNLINCIFKSWNSNSYMLNMNGSSSYQMFGCNFYTKGYLGWAFASTSKYDITNCNFYAECNTTNYAATIYMPAATYINFTNCNFYLNNYAYNTNSPQPFIQAYGPTNFKQCSFVTSNENYTCPLLIVDTQNGTFTSNYINCVFNALGTYGVNSSTTNSGNGIFNNCTFLRGSFATTQPMYMSTLIPNINGPAVQCYNSGLLYIDKLAMSNIPFANRSMLLNGSAKVLINNLDVFIGNGPNYNYLNFNTSEYAAIYCSNEGGIQGNWSARTYSSQMTTSNTFRTGGSNYSIKCLSHRNAANTPYIWMAPTPFTGMPTIFGTPGNHTLTIYFAHKGYDPTNLPNLNDIVVQCQIPIDNNGNYTYIVSSAGGVISPDSSNWNLDSGLTIQKITLSFNLPVAGTVYSRLGFFKYQPTYPNGYVIIDPNFIAG